MKFVDIFLDRITMYRLVLYYLMLLIGIAILFGSFRILTVNPISIIASCLFTIAVCWLTNTLFSAVYEAPTNVESVYISALILVLILPPIRTPIDIVILFWAGVLTMASKYILAIHKKHIFNPVAIALVIIAWGINGSASWWIGTLSFLPFTLLGFLIVRKIKRYRLVYAFLASALLTTLGVSLLQGNNLLVTLRQITVSSPLFFFAFVMLTEPLTTPPTQTLQTVYGTLVGLLFAPQLHFGSVYTTPEIALAIGNVFSYLVSPKDKIVTPIIQKIKTATHTMDFLLQPEKKFVFIPGQYMEWTLPHVNPDSRGNRRYFTIASSPTEKKVRLGIKFYPNGSSYKRALLTIDTTTSIVGAQLSGDFTLPRDPRQKLVFIAGGIGITPFRSMLKYLLDTRQPRPIVLLYVNQTADEIVYQDIFQAAERQLGIHTIYFLTNKTKIPTNWQGKVGRIDTNSIAQEIPDYKERLFYLSGPHPMVTGYEETLIQMGIPKRQIKIDFFPGFV